MSTASFVTTDATTQGSWIGVYGADGYRFPRDLTNSDPSWLSGFSFTAYNPSTHLWGTSSDTKRLQNPSDPTGTRYGITWYDMSNTAMNVEWSADSTTRRVALYCLDDDASGRTQTVEVKDHSGTVLDTRTLSSFQSGKWLVWDVSGNIRITVTRTGPANPVAAAVMWSTPGSGGGGSSAVLLSDWW